MDIKTVDALKADYANNFGSDKWGYCMRWMFALCDFLVDYGDLDSKNNEFEFVQSPHGSDKDEYFYNVLVDYYQDDVEGVLNFAQLLNRYTEKLKVAGYEY